ncbi:hypothetical protein [Streptacidiphilus jiangxiensis]|uniref:Uncharacterized protein n=1 Tax=Streptacidiphilus jiangxiensis TaxID=235985 RepID=A0A1H7H038_STRJI|nr:hypothetical protein [Streptacidiphilus jiangxiensis]SEK43097.1 hypothetical protein SAMN05414137_1023 [Streptacidiphilus jiangxiensis]
MSSVPLQPFHPVPDLRPGAPRFAFSAHPDAVEDLYDLPADVLDQAVEVLRGLVWGDFAGPMLQQHGEVDLRGCRKLRLRGADGGWRMVYTERPAPRNSPYAREVYLLAAGPRLDLAVYRAAGARLTALRAAPAPAGARARAARAVSPNLATRHAPVRPVPATSATASQVTAAPRR